MGVSHGTRPTMLGWPDASWINTVALSHKSFIKSFLSTIENVLSHIRNRNREPLQQRDGTMHHSQLPLLKQIQRVATMIILTREKGRGGKRLE
jgi:hypothetical protein